MAQNAEKLIAEGVIPLQDSSGIASLGIPKSASISPTYTGTELIKKKIEQAIIYAHFALTLPTKENLEFAIDNLSTVATEVVGKIEEADANAMKATKLLLSNKLKDIDKAIALANDKQSAIQSETKYTGTTQKKFSLFGSGMFKSNKNKTDSSREKSEDRSDNTSFPSKDQVTTGNIKIEHNKSNMSNPVINANADDKYRLEYRSEAKIHDSSIDDDNLDKDENNYHIDQSLHYDYKYKLNEPKIPSGIKESNIDQIMFKLNETIKNSEQGLRNEQNFSYNREFRNENYYPTYRNEGLYSSDKRDSRVNYNYLRRDNSPNQNRNLRDREPPFQPSRNFDTSTPRYPRSERISGDWTISLHQALNTIPQFDGNPDKIALFSRAVRDVVMEFGPQSERWVLNSLASKLTGRAADGYTSRLTQYNNVDGLLDDLTLQYSNVGGADRVLSELKTIKQRSNEGAGEYGLRVQKLHNRLLNIYDADYSLHDFECNTYKRRADKDALEQFLFGLLGPLESQVRSRNPTNLKEAIMDAVDFEQRSGARRVENNAAGASTIVPASSSEKNDATGLDEIIIKLAAAIKGQDIATVRRTQIEVETPKEQDDSRGLPDNKGVVCDYCGKPNHTFRECYSLENAIKNKVINESTIKQNNSTTQPINTTPVIYTPFPMPSFAPAMLQGNNLSVKPNNNKNNKYRNSNQGGSNNNNNYGRSGPQNRGNNDRNPNNRGNNGYRRNNNRGFNNRGFNNNRNNNNNNRNNNSGGGRREQDRRDNPQDNSGNRPLISQDARRQV